MNGGAILLGEICDSRKTLECLRRYWIDRLWTYLSKPRSSYNYSGVDRHLGNINCGFQESAVGVHRLQYHDDFCKLRLVPRAEGRRSGVDPGVQNGLAASRGLRGLF